MIALARATSFRNSPAPALEHDPTWRMVDDYLLCGKPWKMQVTMLLKSFGRAWGCLAVQNHRVLAGLGMERTGKWSSAFGGFGGRGILGAFW